MATRTSTTKKVNNWYLRYAANEMVIDMDEQGLYCDVPSETKENETYRVHVDETTVVPVVTHCSCSCFQHKGSCKHQMVVNVFYARIYKSNLEKFVAKFEQEEVAPKVERVAPIEGQVWVEEIQDWAFLPSDEPVDHFASLAGTKVGHRKDQEQDLIAKRAKIAEIKGNLNGAQQTANFWSELPSNKEVA